jgi:hypothetical protein
MEWHEIDSSRFFSSVGGDHHYNVYSSPYDLPTRARVIFRPRENRFRFEFDYSTAEPLRKDRRRAADGSDVLFHLGKHSSRVYALEFELPPTPTRSLVRALSQAIRRAFEAPKKGRFDRDSHRIARRASQYFLAEFGEDVAHEAAAAGTAKSPTV